MKMYHLDQAAQSLVLKALQRDPESLSQAYKMRMAVAYGLERFWGETLRLNGPKATYWQETWNELVEILAEAGLALPNDRPSDVEGIKKMAGKLWAIPVEKQRIAIAVLTQLCDSLVWWTQRYKGSR